MPITRAISAALTKLQGENFGTLVEVGAAVVTGAFAFFDCVQPLTNTIAIRKAAIRWRLRVLTPLSIDEATYNVSSDSYFDSPGDKNRTIQTQLLRAKVFGQRIISARSLQCRESCLRPHQEKRGSARQYR